MKPPKCLRERREQKNAEREKLQADTRERLAAEYQRIRAEQRKADAPAIASLAAHTCKLVIVTNMYTPNGLEMQKRGQEIASAVLTALPDAKAVGVSVNVDDHRVSDGSLRQFKSAGQSLLDGMLLDGRTVSLPMLQQVAVTNEMFDLHSLHESVTKTEQLFAEDPTVLAGSQIAHIALVSAMGIERVDIDYLSATPGNAYLLESADPAQGFSWQQVHGRASVDH